jgi:predicted Zn-dependent peptidase
MKPPPRWCLLAIILLSSGCGRGVSAEPVVRALSNGVRIVVIHFPKSTNVSLFTFLPMGLCSDGPGQAQWSHLVEHLVLRSTFSNDLQRANAETLGDHMRLDFYGSTADWREGLSHHKRWLEGVAFTEASLAAEKPKVIGECDFTARNFATHKFAMAAWSHAWRHGEKHVALKQDVLRAALPEVQRYRDTRLFVPARTTLCAVGGIDPDVFFSESAKRIGILQSQATPAAAVPRGEQGRGPLDVTWDLDARHLLLVWQIPAFDDPNYAALMAASSMLSMRFFADAKLKPQLGHVLAGADLITPEGNFFYVSAPLRPKVAFDDVEQTLRLHVDTIATVPAGIEMLSGQLASSLVEVPDPSLLARRAGAGMKPAMVEGNVGLAFAMNVHRYGKDREALARRLRSLSAADVRRAASKYLGTNGSICRIGPVARQRAP